MPASQLADHSGTTHFNVIDRTDLLMPIIARFLDPKAPAAPTSPAEMR